MLGGPYAETADDVVIQISHGQCRHVEPYDCRCDYEIIRSNDGIAYKLFAR